MKQTTRFAALFLALMLALLPMAAQAATLVYGSRGSDVRQLQEALKALGFDPKGTDGKYGRATETAVRAFQRANGLKVDGKAGSQTQKKLYGKAPETSAAPSTSGNTFTVTLRRGATGAVVRDVQTRLNALGYSAGRADGVYGSGTIAAVKAFQRRNGLTADGLCGRVTYNQLMGSSASAAATSAASTTASSTTTASSPTKLQSGDEGEAVRTLQKALKALDYPLSADGSYGAQTLSAVRAFQQINGLVADGVAGTKTLSLLYGGSAKRYQASSASSSSSSGGWESGGSSSQSGAKNLGSFSAPGAGEVQLLHWQNEIKPKLKTGQNLTVYEPKSGISFTLYVMSRGRHCDVEPLTADDTALMMRAWNNEITWTPKPVYVKLPDGRWSLAVMHNVAHGSQVIAKNDFDGQNCVHFLRDMDECEKNDPDYGVTNQQALRKAWKNLTGVTVD